MALIEQFTPGGNFYPSGQSTFAVLRDIFVKIAENRDLIDDRIIGDAKTYTDDITDGLSSMDEVPEVGDGFGVAGPDGNTVMLLTGEGKLHPDLEVEGVAAIDEVGDAGGGFGVAGPDGYVTMIVGDDGLPHDDFVAGVDAKLNPRVLDVTTPVFNPIPATTVGALSASILNNATKYLLNTWLPSRYGDSLDPIRNFGGVGETNIRPPSGAAFGIAAAIATGVYDPAVTGKTVAEATGGCKRLLTSVAAKHKANGGDWGGHKDTPQPNQWTVDTWQAALWAYQSGAAGWLLWGDLTDEERATVVNMVQWEADRMIRWRLPTWRRNDGGWQNYAGDSKSEEISWAAAVVTLATAMMPRHEHVHMWTAKLVEMGYVSHATQADVSSTTVVNGFAGADVLPGWNVNADYTIVNHDLIHPDYMVSAGASHWGALFGYAATGRDVPKAMEHHAAEIYAALSTLVFDGEVYAAPGGTIYVPGSGDLYYPEGNDWGTHRVMDKALMDVLAARRGWDQGLPTTATSWAELHLQRQADLQARGTDGRTYQAPEEDTFHAREQWIAFQSGTAVLNLCGGPVHRSNATPDIIVSRNRSL